MAEGGKSFQAFGYPDEQFETVISESLHCSICSCVFKDPVMCKNEHCFCRGCITQHLKNSHTCPCCNEDLTEETLTDAPRFFRNLLCEQRIRCDHHKRGCQEVFQLGNLASHVVVCGKAPVLCENEECSSEINREDQFRHQNEECRYREVKCRNCKEMSSMVQEIATSSGRLSERMQKLDTTVQNQSTEVKTGLTALENKFGNRLEEMENRLEINSENVENKLEEMKDKFGEMENWFEKVEKQLLQMEDLGFRDGQRRGERDENENSRSDEACAAEVSSGLEDTKQPNKYAYLVAGGYGADNKPLNSAEVFDKTSNSWIPLKPMKTCRAESSSVVYNGQVFVTGGTSDGKTILSSMEKFSSNVNPLVPPCWSYFPLNLPRALKGHCTVVYRDRMLVIGGYNEETKSCSDIIYEVQLQFPFNTRVLAKLPSKPLQGCGVVLVNDKILIFGGNDFWTGSANVTVYDITKNEVKELAPLPYAVFNMATVKCGENVVLAGGKLGFSIINTVISYNIENQKSTKLPPMKNKRSGCRAVVDGNSLVVMGGNGYSQMQVRNLSSVEAFDFKTSTWRNLPSMNEARRYFTAEIV